MNFESPLTSLVWITSIVSIAITYADLVRDHSRAWRRLHAMVEAGDHHFLRNAGRRGDSGTGKSFHLHRIAARARSGQLLRRKAARRWAFCPASWPEIFPPTTWDWPWSR